MAHIPISTSFSWYVATAVEEYFHKRGSVGEGNRLSCDNKGALTTFDKKCKRISAAGSNSDVKRALQELNRQSTARFRLENAKGHQDRNRTLRDLSLEPRLNVECNVMAKSAVTASIRPGMGPPRQTFPVEKCSIFVRGEKQTSDPKKAIKQVVEREAARG